MKALDAAGGITHKLLNPIRKDSVTIPDGGYTVIRFTADNPVSPDILLPFLSLLFRGILVYFLLLKESRGRSHYECGLTCFLRSPIMHGSQSYNVLPHHLGVSQGGG